MASQLRASGKVPDIQSKQKVKQSRKYSWRTNFCSIQGILINPYYAVLNLTKRSDPEPLLRLSKYLRIDLSPERWINTIITNLNGYEHMRISQESWLGYIQRHLWGKISIFWTCNVSWAFNVSSHIESCVHALLGRRGGKLFKKTLQMCEGKQRKIK